MPETHANGNGRTYGSHDGAVEDDLTATRLHGSALQGRHSVAGMEVDDVLQLVCGPLQQVGGPRKFAAGWIILHLAHHNLRIKTRVSAECTSVDQQKLRG